MVICPPNEQLSGGSAEKNAAMKLVLKDTGVGVRGRLTNYTRNGKAPASSVVNGDNYFTSSGDVHGIPVAALILTSER